MSIGVFTKADKKAAIDELVQSWVSNAEIQPHLSVPSAVCQKAVSDALHAYMGGDFESYSSQVSELSAAHREAQTEKREAYKYDITEVAEVSMWDATNDNLVIRTYGPHGGRQIQVSFNNKGEVKIAASLSDHCAMRDNYDAVAKSYVNLEEYDLAILKDVIKGLRSELADDISELGVVLRTKALPATQSRPGQLEILLSNSRSSNHTQKALDEGLSNIEALIQEAYDSKVFSIAQAQTDADRALRIAKRDALSFS